MVWAFCHRHLHVTSTLTRFTVRASVFVKMHAIKAYLVEQRIHSPQWAQVLAERPIYEHRHKQERDQDAHLPTEQEPNRLAQTRIGGQQRDATKQSAGWTHVLAEEGLCDAVLVGEQHGKQDHQCDQHTVLHIPQRTIQLCGYPQPLDFDPMQQVLYKPKGTQPPAYEPAQHGTE